MDSFRGVKHNCQRNNVENEKNDNIKRSDYINILFYYAKKLIFKKTRRKYPRILIVICIGDRN